MAMHLSCIRVWGNLLSIKKPMRKVFNLRKSMTARDNVRIYKQSKNYHRNVAQRMSRIRGIRRKSAFIAFGF